MVCFAARKRKTWIKIEDTYVYTNYIRIIATNCGKTMFAHFGLDFCRCSFPKKSRNDHHNLPSIFARRFVHVEPDWWKPSTLSLRSFRARQDNFRRKSCLLPQSHDGSIFFSLSCSSPFASSAGSIDFEYISLAKFPPFWLIALSNIH